MLIRFNTWRLSYKRTLIMTWNYIGQGYTVVLVKTSVIGYIVLSPVWAEVLHITIPATRFYTSCQCVYKDCYLNVCKHHAVLGVHLNTLFTNYLASVPTSAYMNVVTLYARIVLLWSTVLMAPSFLFHVSALSQEQCHISNLNAPCPEEPCFTLSFLGQKFISNQIQLIHCKRHFVIVTNLSLWQ